jgi:hypothetical protein
VILKFPNQVAQDAFLKRVRSTPISRRFRIKPSFSQPGIVSVRALGGASELDLKSELSSIIGDDVKVYTDTQFSIMA